MSAGCGQILGANFDDLILDRDAGAGTGGASAGGGAGTGGGIGSGGAGGSGVGGTGTGGTGVGGSGGTGIGGSDAGTGGVTTGGASGTGGTATGGITGSGGTISTGGTTTTGGTSASGGAAGAAGCTGGTVSGVVINEARNSSGDYIELYNTDCADFDLTGYALTDSSGNNPDTAGKETFPNGTILGANQYLLVLGNSGSPLSSPPTVNCSGLPTPCYTVTFGISSSGETIYLLDPASATKDSAAVPGNLTASTSWGRLPDGVGGFTYTVASPKAPNHL